MMSYSLIGLDSNMSGKLKELSKIINQMIKYTWFISIVIAVWFFAGNSFEVLKEQYEFSFTSIGFKKFIELNEHIFKILLFSVTVTTALLAWITVQIYMETYLTTHENNRNIQDVNRYSTYLKHYDNFLKTLDNYLEQSRFFSNKTIDKLCFYKFLFPEAILGNLNISDKYIQLIDELDSSIKYLNSNLPRKLGYADHIQKVIIKSKELGIILPECERKEFLKLEHDLYILINYINSNLGVKLVTLPEYSVYSRN